MTIQPILIGNYANDGTGDDLRTAFEKVNANFTALSGTVNIINGANVGGGTEIFKDKNLVNLEFKTLTSTDSSVTITNTANTVNLKSTARVVEDPSPVLGGNLDLVDYHIFHGDVQTTIWGIDVPILNSLIALLLISNQLTIDMGNIVDPIDTVLELGYITGPFNYSQNSIDFGNI
jgi:hypothetical protein